MTFVDSKLSEKNIDHNVAFKMGDNILKLWGCSVMQKVAILGISRSSYYRYQNASHKVRLTYEQLLRLSYLANIHHSLRMQFTNKDNVYGFMKMVNHNDYFNGQTPLSIIDTGDLGSLSEVARQLTEGFGLKYCYR